MSILILIIKILLVLVPVLISMAFLTLIERKVMAAMQIRLGPNVVGIQGVLQPFADALKLFVKETIIPNHSNIAIFTIAPILSLSLALISWAVIPFGQGLVLSDINLGIMYIFAVSSLSVYTVLCSGWASNSKYAFIGALRSTAQMISYEVSIGLIIITVILCVGSLNITDIVEAQRTIWFIIPLFPAFLMFYVSALAETNRSPFDLPEGESELVSGYNVEYSSMTFALFFLAEYIHIILMSVMTSLLFLGGWIAPIDIYPLNLVPSIFWLSIKVVAIIYLFIWVRASFPRYRYDQLMTLLWKSYLPLSLGLVVLVSSLLLALDALPVDAIL
uniref:NADH-ubiquinone oxidoreductase chain 1 n=1 Tax=Capsaspora owczarzaki TaxID=192875 RepID=M1KFC2_9EUKA|nr:NADH dehydrogenase subunit 1 [Capsaspora owczarzaki]